MRTRRFSEVYFLFSPTATNLLTCSISRFVNSVRIGGIFMLPWTTTRRMNSRSDMPASGEVLPLTPSPFAPWHAAQDRA